MIMMQKKERTERKRENLKFVSVYDYHLKGWLKRSFHKIDNDKVFENQLAKSIVDRVYSHRMNWQLFENVYKHNEMSKELW